MNVETAIIGPNRKLSDEQIRRLRARTDTLKDLMREWDISETALTLARRGKTYREVM